MNWALGMKWDIGKSVYFWKNELFSRWETDRLRNRFKVSSPQELLWGGLILPGWLSEISVTTVEDFTGHKTREMAASVYKAGLRGCVNPKCTIAGRHIIRVLRSIPLLFHLLYHILLDQIINRLLTERASHHQLQMLSSVNLWWLCHFFISGFINPKF